MRITRTAPLQIMLASPRGFCAGVQRAIDIVDRALMLHGTPVYVRHQIVHNQRVVEQLTAKGAVFVQEVDEVPPGAVTVFSAHGVSRAVEDAAQARNLRTIDATCPLVSKVHAAGSRYAASNYDVILIGHQGHPEVVGTLGQIEGRVHLVGSVADVDALQIPNPAGVAYITQTTLSLRDTQMIITALKARFPDIEGPDTDDICYATHNRQNAVEQLAAQVDLLLVVGAANSSNSTRLRELGEQMGVTSYLIGDARALDHRWLHNVDRVGLTAGASAPEQLVREVIEALRGFCDVTVSELDGVVETVKFRMPPELQMQPV